MEINFIIVKDIVIIPRQVFLILTQKSETKEYVDNLFCEVLSNVRGVSPGKLGRGYCDYFLLRILASFYVMRTPVWVNFKVNSKAITQK